MSNDFPLQHLPEELPHASAKRVLDSAPERFDDRSRPLDTDGGHENRHIGKVAEAERQRISAMALFNTDTRVGKVLVAFTPTIKLPPVEPVQAP